MGEIRVEIRLISARGLKRTTSSLWKLQWFAVGWIHPDNKYCTKIDSSANGNPVWKTEFSAAIQDSDDLALPLQVEVYSRDPVFLRRSLLGSATVDLREFVDKYRNSTKVVEEMGSFQVRKRKSDKALGFVDVAIRICGGGESSSCFEEGFDQSGCINLVPAHSMSMASESGSLAPNPMVSESGSSLPTPRPHFMGSEWRPPIAHYSHHPQASGGPPPTGYVPNFCPISNYINMPSGPRFGMGLAAGALAGGGALMYGADILSGSTLGAGVSMSTDPPFYM